MIIVSQDKEKICNFDNTEKIHIFMNGRAYIKLESSSDTTILGVYETKERAKEVLKEMYNWLSSTDKLNLKQEAEAAIAYGIIGQFRIFEMPER